MDLTLLIGLTVAATAMGSMFVFGRRHFCSRAVAAGTVIGVFGAVAERDRLGDYFRPTVVDVVIGVSSAAVLYLVFRVGDRVLAKFMPALHREVGDLYRLRSEAPLSAIPPMIATVAVTEEVFWRGFVQARAGLLVATVAYALVLHLGAQDRAHRGRAHLRRELGRAVRLARHARGARAEPRPLGPGDHGLLPRRHRGDGGYRGDSSAVSAAACDDESSRRHRERDRRGPRPWPPPCASRTPPRR